VAGAPGGAPTDEHARVAEVLGLGAPKRPSRLEYSAPTVDGAGGVVHSTDGGSAVPAAAGAPRGNISRNAPCPCGSGRKYKRCHGAPGAKVG
jgi:preprotein translocase subunit SecA